MDKDDDVYDLLARDLVDNVGLEYLQALEIVSFLENEGFIDYNNLKEIYLYDE